MTIDGIEFLSSPVSFLGRFKMLASFVCVKLRRLRIYNDPVLHWQIFLFAVSTRLQQLYGFVYGVIELKFSRLGEHNTCDNNRS